MKYHRPFAEQIITNKICDYGCGQIALYQFKAGKICCSKHFNSCPGKRHQFSQSQDHKENARKSLKTRIDQGITKTSRTKAIETMQREGTYHIISEKMKTRWRDNPWSNNPYCPILKYKDTNLVYQGSYELNFLENLENTYGIEWIIDNVSRGPSLYYNDENGEIRLYISDFLIGNTVYEIKSNWNWDHKGKNQNLKKRNCNKLDKCLEEGYNVILVLEGVYINYGS